MSVEFLANAFYVLCFRVDFHSISSGGRLVRSVFTLTAASSNWTKIIKLVAAADIVDKTSFQSNSNNPQENFGGLFFIEELRERRFKIVRDDLDFLIKSLETFAISRA
jgi:hypothetical protein